MKLGLQNFSAISSPFQVDSTKPTQKRQENQLLKSMKHLNYPPQKQQGWLERRKKEEKLYDFQKKYFL
jgi:hypothetical protein